MAALPTCLRRWCGPIPVSLRLCCDLVDDLLMQFRPVYAGDIARAVEICCRDDPQVIQVVGGNIIEAGGPEGACNHQPSCCAANLASSADWAVFTYRQIMELVLRYTGMKRFILSLPYFVGMIQGFFLEKLPENLFTLTRDQVRSLIFTFLVNCDAR